MPKQVLPVRELFKFTPEEIKQGLRVGLPILFEDNTIIDLTDKEITLLRFLMDVYLTIPDIKIVSKHCFTNYYSDGTLTSSTINKAYSKVYEDAVKFYLLGQGLPRHYLDKLTKKMYQVFEHIYMDLTAKSLEYITSLNIINLLEIQLIPELLESIAHVYNTKHKVPSYISQDNIEKNYKILDKIMWNNNAIKHNPIAIGYRSGTMSAGQVRQVLGCRGFTTELDSKIFGIPVAGSFTLGLQDIYEMTIESRSGAKALFLSNKAIQKSEYFARELQLATMVIENLADVDCGSKEYLDWMVKDYGDGNSDLSNLLGKYYLNPDTNQEEEITSKHTHLIGEKIKLRSPLYCKHPDKKTVCIKCFGTLGYSVPAHSNLGHFCATTITEKISQSILSTKHLTTSANSGEITLDDFGSKLFHIKNNAYYFNDHIFTPKTKVELIINQRQFFGIKELKRLNDINNVSITRLSRIEEIIIKITKKDAEPEIYPVKVKFNKTVGSFTTEFIHYAKNKSYYLDDNNNNYVIDISDWRDKLPFIFIPVVEYNFSALADNTKDLLRDKKVVKNSGMSTKTPELLLQSLFDILNLKLTINISLIEIIVYALTVKAGDQDDYGLSRGGENITVMGSSDIIKYRSLGAGYDWEYTVKIMLNPRAFFKEFNSGHPMDIMIKPNETKNLRRRNLVRYDKE